MKRTKIALIVIAVITIIGGIMAFKSHRGVTTFCITGGPSLTCLFTYQNTSMAFTTTGFMYCTTMPGSPCSIRATIFPAP